MKRQGGFTLMEMMIAVAILGILAVVLVVSLSKPTNKAKTGSEAQAMLAAFHTAQQQYAVENGVYYSTGASEDDIYPETPTSQRQALGTLPSAWQTLRVRPATENVYCGYVSVAGTADDDIPTIAADTFGMSQPATNWYVVIGKCDINGDGSVFSYYFSSSVDAAVKKHGEGN